MWWLWIILSFFLLAIFWLLLSTIQLSIDTRIPFAEISWRSVGSACIWRDDQWKCRFRILFFSRTMDGEQALTRMMKPRPRHVKKSRRGSFPKEKIIPMLKTFQVETFDLAIDTGSYVTNARLYGLNYVPALQGHIHVNFQEQSHLVLKIKNRPLRILIAFLKQYR